MFRLTILKYDIFNTETLADGIQVKELWDIPLKILMEYTEEINNVNESEYKILLLFIWKIKIFTLFIWRKYWFLCKLIGRILIKYWKGVY
jgi:hypothetical protein